MHFNVSISTWDINGINHKTLGQKMKNLDFLDNIKDHDFIFLIETWSKEISSIPGFKAVATCMAQPKSKSAGRKSGGISLLFKSKIEPMITIEKLTNNFLWCRIDKSLLSASGSFLLWCIYSPSNITIF